MEVNYQKIYEDFKVPNREERRKQLKELKEKKIKNDEIKKQLEEEQKKLQKSGKKGKHSKNLSQDIKVTSHQSSLQVDNQNQTKQIHNFNDFDIRIIKRIFSFLNVMDLCGIAYTHPYWKRIVEKEKDTFKIVNLTVLSEKVNTLDLMKVVQSDKQIEKLYLPYNALQTDTSYLLMCVPQSLEFLQINNISMEFANLFPHQPLENLKTLHLQNKKKRKKPFDDNEIKEFHKSFPCLENLILDSVVVEDSTIKQFFPSEEDLMNIKNLTYTPQFSETLKSLSLLNCPQLTNLTLRTIALELISLEHLELGGAPTNYNLNYSYEGFDYLNKYAIFRLHTIRLFYCSRVGNQVIEILANKFNSYLKELTIVRNCFEKTAKISDEGIKFVKRCRNLEKLNITYSRKFREFFHIHIAMNLKKLKFLGVRECPLQEDLSILSEGCPQLEEVDISGDSWVTPTCLIGLSKHPNLKVLHLGHFDHGDSQCDDSLEEYPPQGMFLEGLFSKQEAFPKLHLIFLEQNCSLTYWLDMRLQKLRPNLTIKYIPAENLFTLNND